MACFRVLVESNKVYRTTKEDHTTEMDIDTSPCCGDPHYPSLCIGQPQPRRPKRAQRHTMIHSVAACECNAGAAARDAADQAAAVLCRVWLKLLWASCCCSRIFAANLTVPLEHQVALQHRADQANLA
jgi:hypothetical protein